MPNMSKFKDILIEAETALRAVQAELLVEEATIDELKYSVADKTFLVIVGVQEEDDLRALYFMIEANDDRAIQVDAAAYGLAANGAIELTNELPTLIENISEEA